MSLTITVGGIEYRGERDGTITPDTIVSRLVADLLDTDEPIGPQTDELAGVTGNLDQYPDSMLAAFLDIAGRLHLKVSDAALPDDPAPVTAAIGDGGFDKLGNWHDPGSGEFAHPGMSTAKALVERAFREMLDLAQRGDTVDALYDGEHVAARWHSPDLAEITRDGRRVRVPWKRLTPTEGTYARLRTQAEGRETPMRERAFTVGETVYRTGGRDSGSKWIVTRRWRDPGMTEYEYEVGRAENPGVINTFRKAELSRRPPVAEAGAANDLPGLPTVAGKAEWYDTTIDGVTYAPRVRTGDQPTFVLVARKDDRWTPVGYSTAATEAEAVEDAEALAPWGDEWKAGPAALRTAPPPDEVRTSHRFDLDADNADMYRHHASVLVNDRFVGVIRQEDRGPDDHTGPWTAVPPADSWAESQALGPFDTGQEAIDAIVEWNAAHPRTVSAADRHGTVTRTAVEIGKVNTIRERVAKLNAKAATKGIPGQVTFEATEPYLSWWTDDVTGIKHYYEAADYTLSTTPLKFPGGWTFAGTVDFETMRKANPNADLTDDNMVLLHSAPGYQLPDAFRGHAVCDQCGRNEPRRNKLIVAADADGNLTRLGTTCVRDVLGHNPRNLEWFDEAVSSIDDDEGAGYGPPPPRVWPVEEFVAASFIADKAFGFTSVKKADADGGIATRDLIAQAFDRPLTGEHPDVPEMRVLLGREAEWVAAREKAQAAIAWVKSDEFRQRNDYEVNLRRAISSELVTTGRGGTSGIAASVVSAYNRHAARQAADAVRRQEIPNEWIGQPGDKLELTGTVRNIVTASGMYGPRNGITIDTPQGTVTTWVDAGGGFADAVENAGGIGGTLRFKATVKSHEEYPKGSGNKQTVLLRVTHLPTRADRLREAAAKADRDREHRHETAVWAVRRHLDQARYAIGQAPGTEPATIETPEQAEWRGEMIAKIEALPVERLEQIDEAAQSFTPPSTARPRWTAPERPARGPGNRVDATDLLRGEATLPDGTIVGYPQAGYDDDPNATSALLTAPQRPLRVTRGDGTVNLTDPATGDVIVSDADLRAVADAKAAYAALPSEERYGRTAYLDKPAVEKAPKPSDPDLYVIDGPGTLMPWHADGYTVTYGKGDNERTVHINPDGSVDGDFGGSDPWHAALEAERVETVREDRLALARFLEAELAKPAPPSAADDADVLTPENLDDMTTPYEVTKGRKVYRVEQGGDVYTVPDGKRVTDKTADPVLRQALTEQGFIPPEPVPAPAPAPAVPEVGAGNDLPPLPPDRTVGSAAIEALPRTAGYADYAASLGPEAAVLTAAWNDSDIDLPGGAAAVQWAASRAFDVPTGLLASDEADAALRFQAVAQRSGAPDSFDPAAALERLHANTQAMLDDAGIAPDATLTLYRGLTVAQADQWTAAGRPDRIGSAPLAAYTADLDLADRYGPGGVVTVEVPAANVVSVGTLAAAQVVAHPGPDGAVGVVRFRAPVVPDDLAVGAVFTLPNGVKVERTPSGYVDQATGRPVAADGTPLD